MEEAPKHLVPDGKYVKIIIQQSRRGLASCSLSVRVPLCSAWPSITRQQLSRPRLGRADLLLRNWGRDAAV
jgi:hypothetical protein